MIRYSRAQQLARKFDELEGMGNTDREPEPIPDLVQGKEPNPEDPPYRERPPGGPPWPGYPKPMPPGGPPAKIASHDNRQFKSVPATGLRGDQPASKEFIEGHLPINDKSLLKIQNDINMEKV